MVLKQATLVISFHGNPKAKKEEPKKKRKTSDGIFPLEQWAIQKMLRGEDIFDNKKKGKNPTPTMTPSAVVTETSSVKSRVIHNPYKKRPTNTTSVKEKPKQQPTAASLPSSKAISSSKALLTNKNSQLIHMFKDGEQLHHKRLKDIEKACAEEKRISMQAVDRNCTVMKAQAQQQFLQFQQELPTYHPHQTACCALCATPINIPRARCIGKGALLESKMTTKIPCPQDCQVCGDCYRTKLQNDNQCQICWQALIANFVCPCCHDEEKAATKYGYSIGFEYCRNDCGKICPEHTSSMICNVCGQTTTCSSKECRERSCDRCGRTLCMICEYRSDGCSCKW